MDEAKKDEAQTWHGFTQDSSMHGIRYVSMKELPVFRRSVWSVGILICLGYFMYAAVQFLTEIRRKTVNTKITVRDAQNLTFPTVTICNRNYWKNSKAQEFVDSFPTDAPMAEIAADLFLDHPLPPPEDKYNWSSPFLQYISSEEFYDNYDAMMETMSHSLNDTFVECYVNGRNTLCAEIFIKVKTDAGSSYSHAAGKNGGIMVAVDALTDEYYIGPNSQSEGFLVALHSAEEIPLMEELGYGVSPGTEVSFLIERQEIDKVPPPADDRQSDCIDTDKLANQLHYHKHYSQSACFDECKVSFVIKECGCRQILQIDLNNTRICSVKEMMTCSTPAEREFPTKAEYLASCNCRAKCKEVQYSAKLSNSKFPSKALARDSHMDVGRVEYMKNNVAVIKIAYGKMRYQHLKERIAYTWEDLIANLGGTLGVCIGGSILTLMEFIEFLVIQATYLLCRRIKKQTTPVQAFVKQ